jgi:hypothetical protein
MRGKAKILELLVLLMLVVCFLLPPIAAFANVAIRTGANITASNKAYFGRYPQSFGPNNGSSQPTGTDGVDYIQAVDVKDNNSQKYYLREAISWRVLQKEGGKVLLLSEKNIDAGIAYNTAADTSITWETSTIRSWLNGYSVNQAGASTANPHQNSFISEAFSAKEEGAIAETTINNPDNPRYNTPGGNDTTDKIFFLLIQEVTSSDLGFTDNNTRIAVNTDYTSTRNSDLYGSGVAEFWWLRSRGDFDPNAATVNADGSLNPSGYTVDSNGISIRPALFLNLSSVLFTSAVAGGKATTTGSGLVSASVPTGDIKFTVTDLSQTLNVDTSNMPQKNVALTFPYSNATTGTNQFISCVLEQGNEVKYYGKLIDASNTNAASGTLSIPIEDVADGTYTLKIFSEQANDDYLTDYASTPAAMTLAVSSGEGTVSTVASGNSVIRDGDNKK